MSLESAGLLAGLLFQSLARQGRRGVTLESRPGQGGLSRWRMWGEGWWTGWKDSADQRAESCEYVVTAVPRPSNILLLCGRFSVVGYFVGDKRRSWVCDQFQYQLKWKHEQICRSKESEDARSEMRDRPSWRSFSNRTIWPAGLGKTGPLADQLFQKLMKTSAKMRNKLMDLKTQE